MGSRRNIGNEAPRPFCLYMRQEKTVSAALYGKKPGNIRQEYRAWGGFLDCVYLRWRERGRKGMREG